MIHIAICDDEEVFVEKIRSEARAVLETQDEDFEIFCYTDGNKLLADYEVKKFDLVLLDIDMPDVDGFEVAEKLNIKSDEIKIAFISSYENLVFKSFRLKPFRFIRKEFFYDEISELIESFLVIHNENVKKINLNTESGLININIRDIMYFESEGHMVYIFTKNRGKLILKRETKINLNTIYDNLHESGFIKIHKSFVVNYKYINLIVKNCVILTTGEELPASINRIKDIKREFLDFELRD